MKYRHKQVPVEVVRWMGGNQAELAPLTLNSPTQLRFMAKRDGSDFALFILGVGGLDQRVDPGDYIVRLPNGSLHPCKPDTFETNYEVIPDKLDPPASLDPALIIVSRRDLETILTGRMPSNRKFNAIARLQHTLDKNPVLASAADKKRFRKEVKG